MKDNLTKKIKFDSFNQYQKHFLALLDLEKREEIELFKREVRELSGKEREKRGRALLKMKTKEKKSGLGGRYIIKFGKSDNQILPENEISVGEVVVLSLKNPLFPPHIKGVVTEKTKFSISIAFEKEPPSFLLKKKVRIDLFFNNITFQRMVSAIKNFKKVKTQKQKELKRIILGEGKPKFKKIENIEFENKNLNPNQKEAVKRALSAENVFLIHGPPGTGKTTTLVEIIEQLVKEKKRVLVTAESNVAVDNILENLTKRGKKTVRIGHPARVIETLRKYSLDILLQDTKEYQQIQEIRKKIDKTREKQKTLIFPSQRNKRGLSDQKIKRLAKKGKTKRGILKEKIKSMAEWLELNEEINYLIKRMKILERNAIRKILEKNQIICATNSTAGSEILENQSFDVAVIDEATQTLEPCCLIPILKAKKVIMAGDHQQLPPTILNQKAKENGLEITLFERLINLYGEKIKEMLEIQYRMATEIMKFPAEKFYHGKLKAERSVGKQQIEKINGGDILMNKICEPQKHIVFVDTNKKFFEKEDLKTKSKENKGEGEIVKKIVEYLLQKIAPQKIGIISPYIAQINLLKKLINIEALEIKTVDGFQGREKDVILVSLVRANEKKEIGFLKDLRRLNVSITRSRKKLILIGDKETLSQNSLYRELIDYIREQKGYIIF